MNIIYALDAKETVIHPKTVKGDIPAASAVDVILPACTEKI